MSDDTAVFAGQELARAIDAVERLVVFTGAGISTESGIPDFRSPGGVWSRYRPVQFQDFVADKVSRERYWQYKKEGFPAFAAAHPNAGHHALVTLQRLGKLSTLITQNIDGLHEVAGNERDRILELHGTERWVDCLSCGRRYSRHEIQQRLLDGVGVPLCDSCDGLLKPATISFGQALKPQILERAFTESQTCDGFLVIGSSLVVQPAAMLPAVAKESGAWLGILNRDETPLDAFADWRCHHSAGEVLGEMARVLDSKD